MKIAFAWLLALSCCLGTAVAQQVVRTYHAVVALDIDTQGQVVHGTPDELPSMFDAPLQEAVSHWRFKPVLKNGVAVTARTYAKVKLEVLQQAPEKYGVRVVCLSNGPSLTFTKVPRFPAEMMRDRVEGTVRIAAIVRADGSITDIRATTTTTASRRPEHAKKVFESVALEAMQYLQAKPEWVDGQPIATAITLPISFGLNGGARGGGASGSAVGSAVGFASGAN